MRLGELKKSLSKLPDEAEVSYNSYFGFNQVALVVTFSSEMFLFYLDPYEGLPKVEEVKAKG